MRILKLCIVALLAVILVFSMNTASASMFTAPSFSIYNTGFGQISPSEIGKTPILFAPSQKDLFSGSFMGTHVMPKLMTPNWTSSMKTSPLNQMFALMADGVGGQPAYG